MWIKLAHFLGLTNLSDEEVEELARHQGARSAVKSLLLVLATPGSLVLLGLCILLITVGHDYSSSAAEARELNRELADKLSMTASELESNITTLESLEASRGPATEASNEALREQVEELKKKVLEIGARAALLRNANEKELAVAAIKTRAGVKVYKREDLKQFVHDADKLIDKRPVQGVGHLAYLPNELECVPGGTGCLTIGLVDEAPWGKGKPGAVSLAKIEAIFVGEADRGSVMEISQLSEGQVADTMASMDFSLCAALRRAEGVPERTAQNRLDMPMWSDRFPSHRWLERWSDGRLLGAQRLGSSADRSMQQTYDSSLPAFRMRRGGLHRGVGHQGLQ